MTARDTSPAKGLAARSTSAVLLDSLREQILHGHLRPGERLMQDAVATRFGVSQTVAREAFRDLVQEGFLVSEPRRGVSVAPMTVDESDEITQLRSQIEAQALAWAIPRMTPAVLDAAEQTLTELDQVRSVNEVIELNAAFHRTLYEPAARPRTLAMIETLRLSFERYLRFTWESSNHLEQSQHEHRQLLGFCRKGEIEQACSLLREHIAATGAKLTERLQSRA
ncbi:MAG: GntR family transcriptional regulator [Rhodocyclaceae bacterium]